MDHWGDVAAHWMEMRLLIGKIWWLIRGDAVAQLGDMVAHLRSCGGSLGRCGGSLERCDGSLDEDVVAH